MNGNENGKKQQKRKRAGQMQKKYGAKQGESSMMSRGLGMGMSHGMGMSSGIANSARQGTMRQHTARQQTRQRRMK